MNKVHEDLHEIEKTFLSSLSYGLWQMDYEQVQFGLKGLLLYEKIKYVEVNTENGNLLSEGFVPAGGNSILEKKFPLLLKHSGQEWKLGNIVLHVDLSSVYQNISNTGVSIILNNGLIIISIVVLMFSMIFIKVTKPLGELANHTQNIRFKHSQEPLQSRFLDTKTEIGQIFRAVAQLEKNLIRDYLIRVRAEEALKDSRNDLERMVEARTKELAVATKDLVESSRKAGMAEVATGVLHNIGNVLTGVNVKMQHLEEKISDANGNSRLSDLADLFEKLDGDLSDYLKAEEKSERIVKYMRAVSDENDENSSIILEQAYHLGQSIRHVTHLVAQQQSNARHSGIINNFSISETIRDVLRLKSHDINSAQIEVLFEGVQDVQVTSDRHKILQIITNVITNSIQAMDGKNRPSKLIIDLIVSGDEVIIEFIDNGIGIEADVMNKLFVFGFTTKDSGNGFGLHSSAIDATALGGKLEVSSEGLQKGATFTLHLPRSKNVSDFKRKSA